jgi:hypothetical protein
MTLIRIVVVIYFALGATEARAADSWTVASPDGSLAFDLQLDAKGTLSYRVGLPAAAGRIEVLAWSPLGLTRDDQAFVAGLRFGGKAVRSEIDVSYTALHGKRRAIRHRATEVAFSFTNAKGAPLDVIVRVANDGAAFRYRFPNADPTPRTVKNEATAFVVPEGAQAWIAPRSPAGKYTPAYEDLYVAAPAGTSSPLAAGWDFPALFRIGARAWALVTESAVDEHYAAAHLAGDASGNTYRVRLPDAAEGQGVGTAEPSSPLPWMLPWRVVIVGRVLSTIFESTLVNDVAPASALGDTSWIKPGRASWSWWSDDDSPKNEAALSAFIDFGAAMGWEYSLIDANWNLMEPAALQRVLARGREQQIGMLLWYNSGGPHNVVTEQPRDRMHRRDVRRKEFAMLREWGVKGVKVDFWQSDKQDRITQYLDLLRDAAEFKLMVDPHGCTLPRGWERTYPHLMSMEAVQGAEQYKFNERYPSRAAWHNTVLAFTRNVVGSMDFTPVTFSDSKFPHLTTFGHELALSVVFESGLQHYADSVKAYEALPKAALDVLRAVPAQWDESRLLAGEPGTLAVVARRRGNDWFVAGISGTDTPQTVTVDVSGLWPGGATLEVVGDGGGPRALTSSTRTLAAGESLAVPLLPRGGFVARVR